MNSLLKKYAGGKCLENNLFHVCCMERARHIVLNVTFRGPGRVQKIQMTPEIVVKWWIRREKRRESVFEISWKILLHFTAVDFDH